MKKEKLAYSEESVVFIKLLTANLRRVYSASLILVIGLPLLFLIYLLFPVGNEVRTLFNGLFLSFEIACVAFFILSSLSLENKHLEMSNFTVYCFWGFVEFFGLSLSFILYYEQRDLTVYYMTLAAVTIVAIMETKIMWMYVGTEMLFTVFLVFYLNMEPYQIVGVAMTNGMFVLLSRMLFEAQVDTHTMKQQIKTMAKDSEEDPLTSMMNRRGLLHQVEHTWDAAVRNKHIVALIMMDIDNFKKYNDTFGHPQGDKCLKSVSETIRRAAGRKTDVPARVGGEEFVVFIPEAGNEDEALRLAEKIRRNVENQKIPHSPLAGNPYVTVSIGVAWIVPGENDTFEKLYSRADQALYASKHNGRNRVTSYDMLHDRAAAR